MSILKWQYLFSRKKFKQTVVEYGETRMQTDVAHLIDLNNRLMDECVAVVAQPNKNASMKQYPVTQYVLHDNAPSYCRELIKSELRFTETLRQRQKRKFEAKYKIDALIKT
jgi:hypothetical protein